jgi:hypothetical protein
MSLYLIYYGAKLHRDHYVQGYEQIAYYLLDTKLDLAKNAIEGLFASGPELLTLDLTHRNYQKLAADREQAFKTGLIPEGKYVPATLTHNNQVSRVHVRLHGQFLDHVASNKWSLRIRFKDNHSLFGMRRFNLMAPKVRYGLYEWICHQLSKYEGLIALHTDYVGLTINGKYKGIYQIEETFDKHLIERNQHREGIVFRPIYPLRIHERQRVLKDPKLSRQLSLLQSLYDRFHDKDLSPSKLFDVEKMAKFYAITDLVSGHHQLGTNNMHLYFNPVTGLLEPIGREWDVHFYRPHATLTGELTHSMVASDFHRLVLGDPVIFSRYIQELTKMSQPAYLNEFFSSVDSALKEKLRILHKDYPYYSFSKEYLYAGQQFISRQLSNANALRPYYRHVDDRQLELLLANRGRLPIEVIGLHTGDNTYMSHPFPRTVARIRANGGRDFTKVRVTTSFPLSEELLRIHWRVPGSAITLESEAPPWPFSGDFPSTDLVRLEPNHEDFHFIRTDDETNTIFIRLGSWDVRDPLVFPPGYSVHAQGGTTINLRSSSCIVSFSKLVFLGSAEEPVVVQSEGGENECLVVLSAKERSTLEYVQLKGLSNPSSAGWELPGAVTFYESPVDIRFSQISRNTHGDDLVNLIRSDFSILGTTFSNARSDALDVDFGTGNITKSRFFSSGNDGLDFSGSKVSVEDVVIDGVGDKGISAGEESTVSVRNVVIRNALIAVASKDLSEVRVQEASLSDGKFGFAIFQKKQEFGPAEVIATSVELQNIEVPMLLESGSSMIRDGESVVAEMQDVEYMLYGAEK